MGSTPVVFSWRAVRPELFWPVSEEIDRGEIFREPSDDVFVLKLSPMNIIGPHYSVIKEESKTIRHLSSFIEKSEKPKEKGRKSIGGRKGEEVNRFLTNRLQEEEEENDYRKKKKKTGGRRRCVEVAAQRK